MRQASSEDVEILKADITCLIGLIRRIDKKYSKGEGETYHYIKRIRVLIDKFNSKYPGIHLALRKLNYGLLLRIFLKAETTSETFKEFYDENDGLKERIFKNNTELDVEVEPVMDKTYTYPVEDTLALKKDKHRNMVELIYKEDSFLNVNSPEFRILSKYALSSYNKKENILQAKDDIFCFDFDDSSDEEDDLMYKQKKTSDEIVY